MAIVINNTVIWNQQQNLKAAMTTDPKLRKVIQKHIREALFEARREVMSSIHFDNGDPRQAAKAVRTSVYRKVLGGNINILTGKKSHGTNSYTPPRTLTPGQRGGNRMRRSERTRQIQSYAPMDRGFILRFVNSGTRTRITGFRNTQKSNRDHYSTLVSRISAGDKARTGNRGAIAARNWFVGAAEGAMAMAANRISEMIEIEVNAIMNGDT